MLQKHPMYAYIPAKDLERARRFYEQTLGFTATAEIAGGIAYGCAGGVAYGCADGTSCFLYPTPNAGTSQASQAFWQIDDVEREVAELKRRGVAFEHDDLQGTNADGDIVTAGGAKAAWFKDSEGNIMAIIQSV